MMIEELAALMQTFPHAVAGGLLVAAVCAFLGVFVILKRIVFIGIALSEVAACGIAAAWVMHLHPFVGAATLTLLTVGLLAYPFEGRRIPRDAVLGVIFVLAGGAGILLVSRSGYGLDEVKALLYGDLILTSPADFRLLAVTLTPVLVYGLCFIRPTLYAFLDRESAKVLGVRPIIWEGLFFLSLGLAVSAASKVAGSLLVFCYLVVAPTTALLLSRRFWVVVVLAIAAALAATAVGLGQSFRHDFPTNQTIAVAACALFGIALLWAGARVLIGRLRDRR